MTTQDDAAADAQYEVIEYKTDTGRAVEAGVQPLTTNATSMFWMMVNADVRGGGVSEQTFQARSGVIIKDDSQVSVSLTELHPQGFPTLGAASLHVLNVVPRNGTPGFVTIRCHNSFNFKIPCRFNIIIVN